MGLNKHLQENVINYDDELGILRYTYDVNEAKAKMWHMLTGLLEYQLLNTDFHDFISVLIRHTGYLRCHHITLYAKLTIKKYYVYDCIH